MWTISQVKEKGLGAVRRNYWKGVLVALILTVVAAGGGGSAGSLSSAFSSFATTLSNYTSKATDDAVINTAHYAGDVDYDFYWDDDGYDFDYEYDWDSDYFDEDPFDEAPFDEDDFFSDDSIFDTGAMVAFIAVFFVFFLIVMLIVTAFAIALDILIFNPLEMGTYRFFFQNLNREAEIKEVAYGFDRSYKNVISVMFFKDLFLFLWYLLLIIPGIIKSYEYRMIPYILSEHPDMPREMAFATSKEMMNGNKWRAFVLDLSFIGWRILSAFTAGILNIFFVEPYYRSTCAALYETLKYQRGTMAQEVAPAAAGAAPVYTPSEPMATESNETVAEDIFEEE